MDTRSTPEQRELQSAAYRLARQLGAQTVGDLDDRDRSARLDAAIDQAGWRDLRSGEPDTPLASGVEAMIVARALASSACDTSFLGPVLVGDLARRVRFDLGADSSWTVAVSDSFDVGAAVAVDVPSVGALSDRQVRVLGVDGLSVVEATIGTSKAGVDLTRPVAELIDASPTGSTLNRDQLVSWRALAITLTAADLVGSMEATTALATEYAKQRRQYGSAIGSYQAVQHLLAEATTLIEGSLSALMYAAWAVDALPASDALSAAAVAKVIAARAAITVCETSIQVHGGIGNTWECMAHVYLRRCLLSSRLFGDAETQLELIAARRTGGAHGLR